MTYRGNNSIIIVELIIWRVHMNKLKELRQSKNYTQEFIADKLGITQGAVSQWEQGKSKPNTEKLIELSNLLHCSVDELLS